MSFLAIYSDDIKRTMNKLYNHDKRRYDILMSKIEEILLSSVDDINHYKNLRYNLSNFKRVHIDKSFVLLFKLYENDNKILFWKFDHHDNIY